jgi:hypothetical protein
MKSFFLSIFSLLFLLQLAAQNRLYVNHLSTGANNGQSWSNAYTDLQFALQAAQAGDEIWVAEGEYKPTANTDRDVYFDLKSGVRLYGGFSGTESVLAQRDWATHPTVFSGDIGTIGDSSDNSYTILYMDEPDSLTLVDGLVFRHGSATYTGSDAVTSSPRRSGGALYIMGADGEAYPVVRHCRFERNCARSQGGAVYVNGAGDGSAAPRFEDCVFEGNSARTDGGAVFRVGGSWAEQTPDFGRCVFSGNSAGRYGGGLFYQDSDRVDTLQIWNCVFEGNSADDLGGAMSLFMGRATGGGKLSIRNCKFVSNASNGGAAINILPAQSKDTDFIQIDSTAFLSNILLGNTNSTAIIYISTLAELINTAVQVSNVEMSGNSTASTGRCIGGEVDLVLGTLAVTNSRFSGNDLSSTLWMSAGKQLLVSNCSFKECKIKRNIIRPFIPGKDVIVQNCLFKNKLIDNLPTARTFWLSRIRLQIKNSTINDDNLFYVAGTNSPADSSTIDIKNTILNSVDTFLTKQSSSTPVKTSISHSCLSNTVLTCAALPPNTCGAGVVTNVDPLFVNPDSGDYRLQPCSPLRDAGNNAYAAGILTDIAGNTRIQGGTVDMGAYETPAFGLAAEPDIKAACAGQPTGAIIAPLVSACEPLSVAWQSGAQSGSALDGLAPGSYAVTLTDAQGRSLTFSATVPVAQPPTFQVDGSPVSCFGAMDAMLAVMPLSGKPPYAYSWTPPVTTDSVATGLGPGPVSVTVTDDWGCTASFSFVVQQPDTLQFAATVTNASTTQSADGSILVNNVTGGTAPYDYLWEPGGSTGDILTGLNPGFYTLTVTDERGCEAVWTFEVKAVLGTGEAEGQAVLVIYPNPAREQVTIAGEFESATPSLIEIYDAAGRLLLSERVSPLGEVWQMSLEGLAAGQYAVLLRDAEGRVVGRGKLIKG